MTLIHLVLLWQFLTLKFRCVQVEIINTLGEQIGTKLAKAEEEGAKGDVDASLKYMEEVEELKKRKALEEASPRNFYSRPEMKIQWDVFDWSVSAVLCLVLDMLVAIDPNFSKSKF